MRLRRLALAALLAALTAVCAQIALPNPLLPGVPFTLQIFAVCLTGALLPPRWAFASQAVYLLLGAMGLAVFAGGGAGPAVLFSMVGGFLWAYPPAAAVCAWIAGGRRAYLRLATAEVVGIAVVYAGGLAGMVLFGHLPLNGRTVLGLASFLPWDVLKALLAAAVALRLRVAVPEAAGS